MNKEFRLHSVHTLTGTIEVMTGLHIGAGNDVIEIGGLDNPVVKDRDGRPYIPGSSIRGKLRSIMEWQNDKVNGDKPHSCPEPSCIVCRIFGPHKPEDAEALRMGSPRLIVRDALMVKETDGPWTEAKYENTICRVTGTAENPRQLERVHAGTKFKFEFVYRNFISDNADEDRKAIEDALAAMKFDYLGGCGSRGSGKVEFKHEGWKQVRPNRS